jgi:hypothetical protein
LTYAYTNSRNHSTCDISVRWLTLLAPEAGGFVDSILLYCNVVYIVIRLWIIKTIRRECGFGLFQETFSAFFRGKYENIPDHNWLQLSKADLLKLPLAVQFVVTRNSSRDLPHKSRDLYSTANVKHNEELETAYWGSSYSLLLIQYHSSDQIKKNIVGRAGGTHREQERLRWGNLGGKNTCKT